MKAREYSTRIGVFVLANCAGLLFLSGCSDEPFPLVRVEGKITYEDGELIPPDELMIRFIPLTPPRDEKTHPRPGTAHPDENGYFNRVTTHKANDGIVRGKHKVLVRGTPETVPAYYLRPDESPLEVDTADAPFHIKIKRP